MMLRVEVIALGPDEKFVALMSDHADPKVYRVEVHQANVSARLVKAEPPLYKQVIERLNRR